MNEIHLEQIDSTQTYAKAHCEKFPKGEITCFSTDEQTAGRGRYQKKWLSPKGVNIYATFYFTLLPHTPNLISLAQLMAHSFAAVLLQKGLDPQIKWPNDILLNKKKVSGVLCETQFHRESVDIFLGIGINVNMDSATAAQIDQPATSLAIETGQEWDRKGLLKALQIQFEKDLNLFKTAGFRPFHAEFEKRLAFKGEKIRFFDGTKEWVGICHSLTEDGQLNLLLPDQTIQTVRSGDIFH